MNDGQAEPVSLAVPDPLGASAELSRLIALAFGAMLPQILGASAASVADAVDK